MWDQIVQPASASQGSADLADHAKTSRKISELCRSGRLPEGVVPLRMFILRSAVVEPLVASLVVELARCGFAANIKLGQLGGIISELLQPTSFLSNATLDTCLVIPVAELVLPSAFDPACVRTSKRELDEYLGALENFARNFNGQVLACNFAQPDILLAPNYQAQNSRSGRYFVERANAELAELATANPNLTTCDLDRLVRRIGSARFWSRRHMASSLQPMTAEGIISAAQLIARTCALVFAREPVKCIILDGDNTLWGGILGEDGPHGIQLGETYPGICFQEFQRQLTGLKQLGFLLALNSKNDPADVRMLFETHPGMVLKQTDFVTARINWNDKAENIASIAEELNIGLDSLVFVDDSDFEIDFVRARFPQVRCLKIPAEPWELSALLPDSGIIDRISLTSEDMGKSWMYAQESQRKQIYSKAGSLDEYLRGLQMVLTFESFDKDKHLRRAAQLTQKTNQFNLTMRRYTEADLLLASRNGAIIFLGSLKDRFGDYGRIILAIAKPSEGQCAYLDTFLMSCRAIGRGVEDVFLRLVLKRLQELHYGQVIGEYVPSSKNALSEGFLERSGFELIAKTSNEQRTCRFPFTGAVQIEQSLMNLEFAEVK